MTLREDMEGINLREHGKRLKDEFPKSLHECEEDL